MLPYYQNNKQYKGESMSAIIRKTHWSDVQDFYGEQDNNNGYIYGMEWEDEVEVDCQWFKSKKERDTEYNEMIASGHYKVNA